MKEFVRRLSQIGPAIYTDEQLALARAHALVLAMRDARFSDALPPAYLHEITSFAAECAASGFEDILLALVTKDRGFASFVYHVSVGDGSIMISPAYDWHVPKRSVDRKVPAEFSTLPRLAIDVSAPQ